MHLALDDRLLGRARVMRHRQSRSSMILIVDGEAPPRKGKFPSRYLITPLRRELTHGIKTLRCSGVRRKASARAGVSPQLSTCVAVTPVTLI